MKEKIREFFLEFESRLQSLEQKLSTLERETKAMREMMSRIRDSLNEVIDYINLDTQIEFPGEGADLRRV